MRLPRTSRRLGGPRGVTMIALLVLVPVFAAAGPASAAQTCHSHMTYTFTNPNTPSQHVTIKEDSCVEQVQIANAYTIVARSKIYFPFGTRECDQLHAARPSRVHAAGGGHCPPPFPHNETNGTANNRTTFPSTAGTAHITKDSYVEGTNDALVSFNSNSLICVHFANGGGTATCLQTTWLLSPPVTGVGN